MLRIESRSIGARDVRTDRPGLVASAGIEPAAEADARPAAAGRPSPGATGGEPAADGPPVVSTADTEPPAGVSTSDTGPPAGQDAGGGVPPPTDPDDPWHSWHASPPGRYVLDWEQTQFDTAVGDVFGYHALQCGESSIDALRANRMPHRVRAVLGRAPLPLGEGSVLRVDHFEELPFDAQSLDLVVLPHVLEFAQDPHQVLREVDRVLRPEGRLIVSGFNPVSLWGARQLVPKAMLKAFLPRDEHMIAVPRLRDWCKLLGFETDRARYGCYRPPCGTQLWLDRTRFMERAGDRWWPICGAVYMVSAIKRVRGMRLIGPAWKRPVASHGLAMPTAQRTAGATDRATEAVACIPAERAAPGDRPRR
jgi:SAM-dependent methyltransferase